MNFVRRTIDPAVCTGKPRIRALRFSLARGLQLLAAARTRETIRWNCLGWLFGLVVALAGCQAPPAAPPPPPMAAPAPAPVPIGQARQFVALVSVADVVSQFQDELISYAARPASGGGLTLVPVGARLSVMSAVGQNASGEIGAGIEVLGYGVHVGAGQKYALMSEQEIEVRFGLPPVTGGAAVSAAAKHLDIAGAAQALLRDLNKARMGRRAALVPTCAKLTFNFELEGSASESGGFELAAKGSLEHEASSRRSDQIEIDLRVQRAGGPAEACTE